MLRPDRQLSILAPTRYPWTFNGPRNSRHSVQNRDFLPVNKISEKLEGFTAFNPWPVRRFDLIHAFNRIPLSRTPFVIGFESHLPRAFGLEGSAYWRALTAALLSPRCRAIVAISDFARHSFLHQHRGEVCEALAAKLHRRYPNLPMGGADLAGDLAQGGCIRLVFVGNHFARKGGCVALRLAELTRRRGMEVELDIVSDLTMGATVWTDPTEAEAVAPYLKLLELPGVRLHRDLPNAEVQVLLRRAHFSLLPTFSDTFGFSVIESMAHHTPAICTTQGALTEFVSDGTDGILLDLPVDGFREWAPFKTMRRDSPAFRTVWTETVERLAAEAFSRMAAVTSDPGLYRAMRQNCRATAERLFAPADANAFWDGMYERAVQGVVGRG
jgi:glycosyltransferase involved in cell wall biosynthesis